MANKEESAQERTEEATPKRREEAREKGQVPRSKDLATMIVLMTAASALFMLGPSIIGRITQSMRDAFQFDRDAIFDSSVMLTQFGEMLTANIMILLPFFLVIVIASIVGNILLGGMAFSKTVFQPDLSRLSLLKGLARMVSLKSYVELLKSTAKFVLVLMVVLLLLKFQLPYLFDLNSIKPEKSIPISAEMIMWSFLLMSSSLIVLALIDIPFQIYSYNKELKMTLQETKDEGKNTEGNPELKQAIRRQQRQLTEQRMMANVPKADVVITNPTHFAVALQYDQDTMSAPIVLAKGSDLLAAQIRMIANENKITIVEAPLLARALYYSANIDQEIPGGLYVAVAQVLAYVYQLRLYRRGKGARPKTLNNIDVPDEFRHD